MNKLEKLFSIIHNYFMHTIINRHNYRVTNSIFYDDVILGKKCFVKNTIIRGKLHAGKRCKLIDCDIKGKVTLGNYTTIMGPNTIIRGAIHPISIGSFCSIARSVHFQEYSHKTNTLSTYFINQNLFHGSINEDIESKGAITVKNDVWIGAGAIILSGVTIGNGAIIAANSVVTKDVPDYAIVAGMPATTIKYRFKSDLIKLLNQWQWWLLNDEQLKELKILFSTQSLTVEKIREYMNE